MNNHSKRQGRAGFTLVELLVVVAIIALLMALLVPALSRARDQAKTTRCLANLHGLVLASSMYTADWNGLLCPSYWGGGADPNIPPPGQRQTLGLPDILAPYATKADWSSTFDQGKPTIFTCPCSLPTYTQWPLTYGANSSAHIFLKPDPVIWRQQILLTNLSRPGQIISMGDTAQGDTALTSGGWIDSTDGNDINGHAFNDPAYASTPFYVLWDSTQGKYDCDYNTSFSGDLPGYHFRFRHNSNKVMNVTYIDGHSESITMGKYNPPQAVTKRYATNLYNFNIGVQY